MTFVGLVASKIRSTLRVTQLASNRISVHEPFFHLSLVFTRTRPFLGDAAELFKRHFKTSYGNHSKVLFWCVSWHWIVRVVLFSIYAVGLQPYIPWNVCTLPVSRSIILNCNFHESRAQGSHSYSFKRAQASWPLDKNWNLREHGRHA